MSKIIYDSVKFDSQLEVDYYKYLKELGVNFIYHPKSLNINLKNKYTPDFIVIYDDRIEIIETKGYNQFSYMRDSIVHNQMLEKTEDELREYIVSNNIESGNKQILYKKIKYLNNIGWVDFDFKKPNITLSKKNEKIKLLENELKELRIFKKDIIRYFNYKKKDKLTKSQLEWIQSFETKVNLLSGGKNAE